MSVLNLPALSESDPGKPIKASWGDRVVTAIQTNCDNIIGFGKANSWFQRFAGDGSDGDLDVPAGVTVVPVPLGGLQYQDLTIRAGGVLALAVGAPNPNGIYTIGVSGTLTMEAGSQILATGLGIAGGLGAGAVGAGGFAVAGAPGSGSAAYALSTAGGGGGGGANVVGGPQARNGGPGGPGGGSGYPVPGGAGGAGGLAIGGWGVTGAPGLTVPYQLLGPSPSDKGILGAAPGGGGGGGGGPGTGAFDLGGFGGNGGAGGPYLGIEANTINCVPGSTFIIANGLNGATGGAGVGVSSGGGGGGAGGAGGNGALCYADIVPLSGLPIATANGGIGGAPGPGGSPGAAPGAAGASGAPGLFRIVQV